MITITDAATEKAKEILAAEGKPDGGLRIYMAESSCGGPSYGMDIDLRPDVTDEVIEKNGLKVFVDRDTARGLHGLEIDFINDGEREGFILNGGEQPAAEAASCNTGCNGCG